jgi:predicted double-glycine peptidase
VDLRLALPLVVLVAACHRRPDLAVELAVPDVNQDTDYTCSASALQGVLAYYGDDRPEATLAVELGATPADGAPPAAIVRVAREHHLDAIARDDTTLDQLAGELAARRPVIVDLQAWADPPRTQWSDDWADGHYVVLIAIDGDTLVFEDPSLAGKRATLSAAELETRWHDEDAQRRHAHTAILFHTAAPASPRAVVPLPRAHMD